MKPELRNDQCTHFVLDIPCSLHPSATPFVPGINTEQPPAAPPPTIDAETEAAQAFAWCFSRQYDSLILVSGILIYPFYSMTLITVAARIPYTEYLGLIVLALTGCCFYGATAIRFKTMLLIRAGRKTALMKHMAQVNQRYVKQGILNPAGAPFLLLTIAMGVFAVQLMAYVLFCGQNLSATTTFWQWGDNPFTAALGGLSVYVSAYVARMTYFALWELGNPQTSNAEHLEQLLHEKV